MKRILISLLSLTAALSTSWGNDLDKNKPVMLKPDDMTWRNLPEKGVKNAIIEGNPTAANALFALRIELPDNFKIPPHFHPSDEHIVVLSGTLNMGIGDNFDKKRTKAYPAGSFIVMPKGTHHFAWTTGKTIFQVYAIGPWGMTYVNPKDHAGCMN